MAKVVVWFAPFARKVMVEHCKSVYPHEGCGILVGERQDDFWFITRSVPVLNRNTERSHDRFEISPHDYLRVEKEARKDGWDIVGFFHSHPDVAPYPSPVDAQFAWANFLTVIVGVFGGQKVRVRAHLYDGQQFRELPIRVLLQSTFSSPPNSALTETRVVDITNEVEPFVTLSVRTHLESIPAGQLVRVRFNYEPALRTLLQALPSWGHQPLVVWWDEEGAWEILVRASSANQSDCPSAPCGARSVAIAP